MDKPSLTPELAELSATLSADVMAWMIAREAEGVPYRDAAIDAAAALGDQLAIVFSAIGDPIRRQRMIDLFCRHLPRAVAKVNDRVASERASIQ